MTLKEFLEKNPEAVKEAAACKTVEEFKNLAQKAGIVFDSEDKLKEAFELVKSQNDGALDDDALDAVSGGSGRSWKIDEGKIATDYDGRTIYVGDYKKK